MYLNSCVCAYECVGAFYVYACVGLFDVGPVIIQYFHYFSGPMTPTDRISQSENYNTLPDLRDDTYSYSLVYVALFRLGMHTTCTRWERGSHAAQEVRGKEQGNAREERMRNI